MFVVTTSGVVVHDPFAGLDVRDFALTITVVAYKLDALVPWYADLDPKWHPACERHMANRLMQHGSL